MTEIPKRLMIILKAKPTSLRSAETFLQNRNWDVLSTTEVKTALPAILAGKASYILLTVEHANSGVIKLAQVITQTLRIPIIFFAEGLSIQGPATLNELKSPYVIYPPASGPSIERMILKIERDLEADENLKAQFTRTTESTQKAREQFAQVFSGDPGSSMDFFAHQKGTSTGFSLEQKGLGQNIHSVSEQKPANQNIHNLTEASGLSSAHTARPEGAADSDVLSYLNSENFDAPDVKGSADTSVFAKKGKSLGKNIIVGLEKSKPKKEDGRTVNGISALSSAAAKTIILPGSGEGKTDSILIQGAHHAIERVVKAPDTAQHALGVSTRLHCFFVDADKFRGYVLVAYAQNQELEKKFKEDLHRTFVKFIKASGVAIQIQDSADISILEVDFEEWSLKESEFLIKSVHAGAEVAVTFFPADKDHALIEATPDGKMLSVPLEEIEVDVPLEFDLFLFMPTNSKYFHYTKKNGKLSQAQKDRLLESQKGHLHVLAEARDNVAKYRTMRFVNDKIRKHRSRKAS